MADHDRVDPKRPWTRQICYSRASRRGSVIEVSGTTATGDDGAVLYPGDAYQQARHSLETMMAAVERLGGSRADVTRTRAFLTNIDEWPAVGRAHSEFFAGIDPASTSGEASRLMLPGLLVELEASAIVLADGAER